MPSLVWPSLLVARAAHLPILAPRPALRGSTMAMPALHAYPFVAASDDVHAPYSTR